MHIRFSQLLILGSTFLAAACAGLPINKPLADNAKGLISSTDVVLPIQQREIYVFVPNTDAGAAGGGLLGALVASAVNDVRTTKAEDAVKPLRDSLIDFSFDNTLQSDLQKALSSQPWLHADGFRVIKEPTPANLDKALESSKDAAVLFVSVDYNLANDADILGVTLNVALYPNTAALKAFDPPKKAPAEHQLDAETALYRNVIWFQAMVPGSGSDRDQNIAAWSAQNGAAMRSALQLAADRLSGLVALDLQRANGAAAPQGPRRQETVQGFTGDVVNADSEGMSIRFEDGSLRYVTTSMLDH